MTHPQENEARFKSLGSDCRIASAAMAAFLNKESMRSGLRSAMKKDRDCFFSAFKASECRYALERLEPRERMNPQLPQCQLG